MAARTNPDAPLRVLFVCLGNICRSPLAEGVFRALVADAGLDRRIEIDSAGTGDWHVGEPPHPRTLAVAERRGVRLDTRARQVEPADLRSFDLVVAMDAMNYADLERLSGPAGGAAELRLLREFDPEASGDLDVPDPYSGGAEDFEHVHDVVARACAGLLDHVRRTYSF